MASRLCVFFGLLALFASCGEAAAPDRDDIAIIVNVQGLSAEVSSLEVSATLDGMAAKNDQQIKNSLSQFVIYLPKTTRGALQVSALALGSDTCKVGSGQAMLQVEPNPPYVYELALPLTLAPARLCTLTVHRTGTGSVVSAPPGILCTHDATCSADFPVGTQVTLHAMMDARSLGVSWSGACTGSDSCMLTADAQKSVTARFPARVCSPDSWCWYAPLPQGNAMAAIWGSAANDVWIAGGGGTILRFDGTSWQAVLSNSGQDLSAVRGTSASDVWAVGKMGTLLHWNGTGWSLSGQSGVVTSNNLNGVFGNRENDYFAVGQSGTILHYDGTSWSKTQSGTATLSAVFAFAANDAWAVGAGGVILHFDGTNWQASPQSGGVTTQALSAIWGSAANDVYAAGAKNTLLHYDGASWSLVSLTTPMSDFATLWGSSASDVWVGGASAGAVLHFDGTSFTAVTQSLFSGANGPVGIWGSAPDNVTIIGSSTLAVFDGTNLAAQSSSLTNNILQSVFGVSASDVWSVGQLGTILHFDGTRWSPSAQSGTVTSNYLYALWGQTGSSIWAVGANGTLINWNGTTWIAQNVGTQNLFAVWGQSASDIWAVGQTNRLLHYNGATWSPSAQSGSFGGQNLIGVWGTGASDVWSVGTHGLVVHYAGSSWTQIVAADALTMNNLFGVWGSGPSDIWAVGQNATIAHYDGTSWKLSAQSGDVNLVPKLSTLRYLWGSTASDVWAVGDDGTLLHFDGVSWSAKLGGAPAYSLSSVFGLGANDVWMVGSNGAILRHQ